MIAWVSSVIMRLDWMVAAISAPMANAPDCAGKRECGTRRGRAGDGGFGVRDIGHRQTWLPAMPVGRQISTATISKNGIIVAAHGT